MIAVEQNSEEQLRRLAAQRRLYSSAKTALVLQVLVLGPVAVATTAIGLWNPPLKGIVATWGLLVVLGDLLWLGRLQRDLRERAAKIQEEFDCDVLELPWNSIKAGHRPDPELVKEHSEKFKRSNGGFASLSNWYSPAASELPIEIGRIACQRSNCWWDSKQRRRYGVIWGAFAVAAFVSAFVVAVQLQMTTEDFVLMLATPLAPAVLLGTRHCIEQNEAAARAEKLKTHSERLWVEALHGRGKTKLAADSRVLQDEIFDHRRRSPLVFDWVFNLLRSAYEEQMNFGVEALVAEAKRVAGPSI